jgi:hypothetical protein
LRKLAGETAAAIAAAAGSAADTLSASDEAEADATSSSKRHRREDPLRGGRQHGRGHRPPSARRDRLHRPSMSCTASALRALGWRDDFGNESYWAVELGQHDRWPSAAPTICGPSSPPAEPFGDQRQDKGRHCVLSTDVRCRSGSRKPARRCGSEVRAFLAEEIAMGTFDPTDPPARALNEYDNAKEPSRSASPPRAGSA